MLASSPLVTSAICSAGIPWGVTSRRKPVSAVKLRSCPTSALPRKPGNEQTTSRGFAARQVRPTWPARSAPSCPAGSSCRSGGVRAAREQAQRRRPIGVAQVEPHQLGPAVVRAEANPNPPDQRRRQTHQVAAARILESLIARAPRSTSEHASTAPGSMRETSRTVTASGRAGAGLVTGAAYTTQAFARNLGGGGGGGGRGLRGISLPIRASTCPRRRSRSPSFSSTYCDRARRDASSICAMRARTSSTVDFLSAITRATR